MKVTAITVDANASDPAHPDHARWVKDYTLAMEVAEAKRRGLPLSVAEANNQRLLERADKIAKNKSAASKPDPRRIRESRDDRHKARGVTVRQAKPLVSPLKLSPCGRCGTCRACMRERRVLAIIIKAKQGDAVMLGLAWQMTATALDAQGGVGRYLHMSKADRDRAVTAKAELICDQSVRWLGAWL